METITVIDDLDALLARPTFVCGPAGSGKTVALRAIEAAATEAGWAVHATTADRHSLNLKRAVAALHLHPDAKLLVTVDEEAQVGFDEYLARLASFALAGRCALVVSSQSLVRSVYEADRSRTNRVLLGVHHPAASVKEFGAGAPDAVYGVGCGLAQFGDGEVFEVAAVDRLVRA
jgi:type II secretory pathway predicted ATPase ExeA